MYRYVKTDKEVKWLCSISIPYSIELIFENDSIESSTDVYLDTDIFEHIEEVEHFEELVSNHLRELGYRVIDASPNSMGNGIYLVIAIMDPNNIIKVKCEMFFIARMADHHQNEYPDTLSEEIEHTRDNRKSEVVDRMKRYGSIPKSSNPKFPDADYSVKIEKGSGEEENYFGSDQDKAARFIANDIDDYVKDIINSETELGRIEGGGGMKMVSGIEQIDGKLIAKNSIGFLLSIGDEVLYEMHYGSRFLYRSTVRYICKSGVELEDGIMIDPYNIFTESKYPMFKTIID